MGIEDISTLDLSELTQLPSFPTIGEIFNVFSEVVGLKEKQKKNPGFKRKLQYLANEDKKVDPDTYEDVLFRIIEEYDAVSEHLAFHWLSGSQIYHYLRSYQHLILHFPIYGLDQNQVNNLAYLYILYISFRRLLWWDEGFKGIWFPLETCDPKSIFDSCIIGAVRAISDKDISTYAFVKMLYPEFGNEKEDIKPIVDQLKSWGEKATSPYYQTFKYKIVEPMKRYYPEVAQTLETDFLGWKWISTLLSRINIESDRVFQIIAETFYSINNNGIKDDYIPPSDYTLEDEALLFHISKISQYLLSFLTDDDEYENWQNQSLNATYPLPDPINEDPEIISEYYNKIVYRDGPSYSRLTRIAFNYYLKEDSPYMKDVFRSRFYHGLLKSSYRTSQAWLTRQKEAFPERIFNSVDEDAIEEWLGNANKKNVDFSKCWSRYSRTRLMMAVSMRKIEIVKNLLELGADPLWISKNRTNKPGDDSSVLLIVLQHFLESPCDGIKAKYRQLLYLILDSLEGYNTQSVGEMIVRPTRLKHICPLSLCIELGDPEILRRILKFNPDLNEYLGGDEYYPIYYAVTAYSRAMKLHFLTDEGLLDWLESLSFNHLRMVCPASLIDSIFEDRKQDLINVIRNYRKNLPNDPSVYTNIIKQLSDKGAKNNALSHNGRYPMDMAIELFEDFNDVNMLEALNEIGEIKRALL